MVTFGDQSSIALQLKAATNSAISVQNVSSSAKCLSIGLSWPEPAMDQLDQLGQETGFIASQPVMAQYMTGLPALAALPHINESFQTPSSITGGSGPSVGPPVVPVVPRAAAVQHQQHNRLTPVLNSCTSGTDIGPLSVSSASVESPKSGQGSAEFAWMKEKKTTRKQQHSGRHMCIAFDIGALVHRYIGTSVPMPLMCFSLASLS